MKLKITLIGAAAMLAGCAHLNPPPKPKLTKKEEQVYVNRVMLNEIKTSSVQIENSLSVLNNDLAARYGKAAIPFKNIKDPRLDKNLSISWYGPVEEVLKNIAKATGYQVQYFGKVPAFPVIVIVGKLNGPEQNSAINFLRNIAIQARRQATITINTKAGVIAVRYINYDNN